MSERDLLSLYVRKQGFAEYRRAKVERSMSNAPAEHLKELKAKRARITAELDAEIAKAQLRLAQQGIPVGATERRRIAEAELRVEKAQLDHEFAMEVKRQHNAGVPVAEIAKRCGATSTSVFYQAVNYSSPEVLQAGLTSAGFNANDHEWEYSDISSVHRYALNETRAFVKMHDPSDPEEVAYVLRADGSVLGGTLSVAENYDAERVDLLERILNGEEDTSTMREWDNPYK